MFSTIFFVLYTSSGALCSITVSVTLEEIVLLQDGYDLYVAMGSFMTRHLHFTQVLCTVVVEQLIM